jgi:predicted PurR-regulated permease PerM
MLKISKNQKYLALDVLFVCLGLALFLILDKYIINVIAPFVYALVLSYLLDPLIKFMEARKIKRIYGIIIVFLSIVILISLLFMSFIPSLAEDVSVLVRDIPGIFSFITNFISDFPALLPEGLYEFMDLDSQFEKISQWISDSLSQFSSVLVESTKSLINIVMTPLITFYYLKDKEKFISGLLDKLGPEIKKRVSDVAGRIDKVFGGFIKGQLLVAAFVGILTGIGCKIIGVPYSLTIGLVAGVTNIIPYFGPWLGGILPVILALMNAPITALWVLLLIVGIQQVEAAFISPQIMSHSVGLHPLTVMFSVLLFGNAMGIPGMILGVPITGTLKVIYNYILEFREEIRNKKVLES